MVSVWPEPPNARSAAPPAGAQLALLADWPYDDLRRPEVLGVINKPRQTVSLPGLGFDSESKLHRIRNVRAMTWRPLILLARKRRLIEQACCFFAM